MVRIKSTLSPQYVVSQDEIWEICREYVKALGDTLPTLSPADREASAWQKLFDRGFMK